MQPATWRRQRRLPPCSHIGQSQCAVWCIWLVMLLVHPAVGVRRDPQSHPWTKDRPGSSRHAIPVEGPRHRTPVFAITGSSNNIGSRDDCAAEKMPAVGRTDSGSKSRETSSNAQNGSSRSPALAGKDAPFGITGDCGGSDGAALHVSTIDLTPQGQPTQRAAASAAEHTATDAVPTGPTSQIHINNSSFTIRQAPDRGTTCGSLTAAEPPGPQSALNSTPANTDCTPPVYESPVPQGVPIPPLSAGQKPNFIVILTDDQGWDDIGLHNPGYVNTPNLDRFIRSATLFDNFYTSPQCSPSRSMLLTGRDSPKTGTVLVNAGYDSIHKNETTLGEYMSAAGYSTAQFGKWHNGQEMGYEPWNRGFQESWTVPISLAVQKDPIFVHNGEYVSSKGWLEQVMMDKLLGYLDQQTSSQKPFVAYYATHSIHAGSIAANTDPSDLFSSSISERGGVAPTRPVPPEYKHKYYNHPKYAGISDATKDAFAMLEYLDTALGRLFKYLSESPLGQNTYVMIGGDNGSALLGKKERQGRLTRMPSKMQGEKSLVLEGGIRNFWAVQGPGVEAGVIDSTLLALTDVLPTISDLTGVDLSHIPHLPWDGTSFRNLLVPGRHSNSSSSIGAGVVNGYRGISLATAQQADRMLFSFGSQCWDYNAMPVLGTDRQVKRPQALLSYTMGGQVNTLYSNQITRWLPRSVHNPPGFQECVAVRWRGYKWVGLHNKVYRFNGSSHIELPCAEVSEPEASQIAAKLSAAAKNWWYSVAAAPYSFTKPTVYLGLGNGNVTNLLPQEAKERTGKRVEMLANGVGGFRGIGDRLCLDAKVMRAGTYGVVLFYTSSIQATFKLSVGSFPLIMSSKAANLVVTLPQQPVLMQGMSAGTIDLQETGNIPTEACLSLLHTSDGNVPVFRLLSNVQFQWLHDLVANNMQHAPARAHKTHPTQLQHTKRNSSALITGASSTKNSKQQHTSQVRATVQSRALAVPAHLAVPAPGLDMSGKYSWLKQLLPANMTPGADEWAILRRRYGWPDGQSVLESMFSPYETELMAEDIMRCPTCTPQV